jgi:hypothetical protein
MKPPSGSVLLPGGQITQEMQVRRSSPNVSCLEFPSNQLQFRTLIASVAGRPPNEITSVLQVQWKSNSRAVRSERLRELR